MKTRIFLVAACLMLFASLSFGQGFSAFLVDADVPLSATCGGADYYADGTATLMIYWDNDSNGPDADDPQPTVGNQGGNVNYNQFAINGEGQGIGAGFFASESDFTSVGIVPQPPRYYLRVLCSDGSQHWVSEVATLVSGPSEVYFTNWNCSPCPDQARVIHPNGGEILKISTADTIRWRGTGLESGVRIELNRNFPTGQWEALTDSTENDSAFEWLVTGPASANCRIRLSAVNDILTDISDANFSIIRHLTLLQPNGGGEWNAGSQDTVRWTGGDFDFVRIELNRNYPSGTWEVIEDSAPNDGLFLWQVTLPVSDFCRVKLSAVGDTLVDVSDSNFTIQVTQGYLALVRMSSPNTPVLSWSADSTDCGLIAQETFRLKNFGVDAIVLFQPLEPPTVEFSRSTSCGSYFALAPNQISACSLSLMFDPNGDGTYQDTLLIQTDAVNEQGGYVRIPLAGSQITTPATPQVVIDVSGEDAVLHWYPVTESVGGCPVNVTRYLVFYSPTSNGPYYYHGWTADTTYTHFGVITYASGMYYEVIAIAGGVEVSRLVRGMTREEVEESILPYKQKFGLEN